MDLGTDKKGKLQNSVLADQTTSLPKLNQDERESVNSPTAIKDELVIYKPFKKKKSLEFSNEN